MGMCRNGTIPAKLMDYETYDKLPVSVKWKIHDISYLQRNKINCFSDIF